MFYRFLSDYPGANEKPNVSAILKTPILAGHNCFLTATEAVLPGGFQDPVGRFDTLDISYFDDRSQEFLTEVLNVRTLTLVSYIKLHLGSILRSGIKVGEHTTLIFTKVMDELKRGLEEGPPPPPTDRSDWEKRASKATVQLVDDLLEIAREIDPSLALSYNKHYIGIYKNGQPLNFCTFRPKKNTINIAIRLERSDEIDQEIDETGIEQLAYAKYGAYRLSLQTSDVAKHREFLKKLMQVAYQTFTN